jgi:tetratricopeptide (TPR) repeat protein
MRTKAPYPWANLGPYDACPCGSGRKYKFCCKDRIASEREKPFIAELRPDIDDEVDEVLMRVEVGEGVAVRSKIASLLAAHPNYHMTNYAMGVYLAVVAKDLSGAMPFFEKAVEIFPPFPEAHFNLGNAARQLVNIPKAVAAYRNAQRYSSPDDIGGMAREQLELLEEILLKNTKLKTIDAYLANEQIFEDAFACLNQREFERALELFQRVLEGIPNHVQSYGNMALAYAGLGKKAAAIECLDKALAWDPSYEPAQFNRQPISEMKEGEPSLFSQILEVQFYSERFGLRTT